MNVKHTLCINSLLALALALTPFILFPVCSQTRPDGSHMGCYYSGILITALGCMILLASLIAIFTSRFYAASFITSAILAVLCWLIPEGIITVSGIGLCGDYEHACRAVTMPKAGIFIVLIVIVSIAGLIINFVKSK